MKAVEIDFFKKLHFPLSLKSGSHDTASFLLQNADMRENRYRTDLWLYHGGDFAPITNSGNIKGHWWNGDDLVFSALQEKKDKRTAKKGIPLTVLYRVSPQAPQQVSELLRLYHRVTDIAFLPGEQDFLFLAEFDPALTLPLSVAALREEKECSVFTELPFWENGGGPVSGKRQRLYRYCRGQVSAITDEKTAVDQLRLSPSGKIAYFVANRYETVAVYKDKLMRLDIGSGKVWDISFCDPFLHLAYAALADDDLLVFGTDMQKHGLHENGCFFRLDAKSGALRLLYDGGDYDFGDTVASDVKMNAGARMRAGDGGAYWITTIGADSHLMHIDAHSGKIRRLTRAAGAVMECALTGTQLLFTAMRGLLPPEIYCLMPDGREAPFTAFNAHAADTAALSQPQALTFVNSGGTPIEGWVMRPLGWQPGPKYPVILNIHGGPKVAYGTVLFHEMQYWAGRGFGVMFCNPTGSDGRGDAFADLRGRYGSVDYDDIMGFVDAALAAHPWMDGGRLGVAGGSYGGYMTNWIIGHTHRFAAAVSQRGISNWISMAAASDIGYFFVPDQTGVDPFRQPAQAWAQSPLQHAPRVKTPTLFIHSDEDYRCWMAEALQMYTALQMAGTPCRLCLFHGENHELSRSGRPRQRVRRLQEITEWFEKYLT